MTAAGSWIQLVIASIAAVVWWAAAPGTLVSEVAFAAVLIGGITTVFMNVNPLIPLDGYYALSDYLEVPNLRQRAFAHLDLAGEDPGAPARPAPAAGGRARATDLPHLRRAGTRSTSRSSCHSLRPPCSAGSAGGWAFSGC